MFISSFPIYIYILSPSSCEEKKRKKLVKKKICMSIIIETRKKGRKGQCLAIFSGRKFDVEMQTAHHLGCYRSSLKLEKSEISNVCLGGCTITTKAKSNVF